MRGRRFDPLPYMFVSGVLLLLLLVITFPTFWAFSLSFQDYSIGTSQSYVGIRNYRDAFRDPLFWNAFVNNMVFVLTAVGFELLVGFWVAVLLTSKDFRFQKLWISLIMAPYAISPVVSVVVWKYMLNTDWGIINYLLSFLGFKPLNWIGTTGLSFVSIILVDVWMYFPFIFLLLYAAIRAIPGELFECAGLDGASFLVKLRYITLPSIQPAVFVALTFRTIFVFRTFDIPWILTKGGPANSTDLLSIYLYKQGFGYWKFGSASAVGWIMLVITLFLSLVYIRLIKPRREEQ